MAYSYTIAERWDEQGRWTFDRLPLGEYGLYLNDEAREED